MEISPSSKTPQNYVVPDNCLITQFNNQLTKLKNRARFWFRATGYFLDDEWNSMECSGIYHAFDVYRFFEVR